MPRLNTNVEVIKDITVAGYISDAGGGGNSTLSAATAIGATTAVVVSATGFLAGDLVRIGTGNQLEENIVDSIATNTLTLRSPLVYAHAIGEAAMERQKVVTGEVADSGVKISTTAAVNKLKTATTKGVYLTMYTDADYMVEWQVVNHSLENVATMHGMPEAAITGTGTTNSPRRLVTTMANLMTVTNISTFLIGHRNDGVTQEVQVWNVDLTPTGDRTYVTGSGVPLTITGAGRAVAQLEYP